MVDLYFAVNSNAEIEEIINSFSTDQNNSSYNLNLLMSYHYFKNKSDSYFKGHKKCDVVNSLFLDSGAFSAFNSGSVINIDKYIEYINSNHESFDYIAQLDVIDNGNDSLENYIYMLDKVKCPEKIVPVFHFGSDLKLLSRINNVNNSSILAVGGIAKRHKTERSNLIKKVINNCDKKLHLFGVTDYTLIKKYKNYINSVDSTSYKMTGIYGYIHHFRKDKLLKILISDRQINEFDHLYNLPKNSSLIKSIEEVTGVDIDTLSKSSYSKWKANIIAQLKMMEYINKQEIVLKKQKSLV